MKLIRRTILATGIAGATALGVITTAVAEQHAPQQHEAVTKSLQGHGPATEDPRLRAFYTLLVEARAKGAEKVDAGLEKKIREMVRQGPPGHGLDAKGWEDHVVDMAGQMLVIGKKDPKVFESYESFITGMRGPE